MIRKCSGWIDEWVDERGGSLERGLERAVHTLSHLIGWDSMETPFASYHSNSQPIKMLNLIQHFLLSALYSGARVSRTFSLQRLLVQLRWTRVTVLISRSEVFKFNFVVRQSFLFLSPSSSEI